MLHPVSKRRIVDPAIVDRTETREALRPHYDQNVLFSGVALNPRRIGARTNEPFAGGPSYLIAGPRHSSDRIPQTDRDGNRVLLPNDSLPRYNPQGIAVQPYDPTGELAPSEMGPPLQIDHASVYQRAIHRHPDADGRLIATPAIHREPAPQTPVVGAGIVNTYRKDGQERMGIKETPFPVASSAFNDILLEIARLPANERTAALDAAYAHFGQLNQRQAIAYDVTVPTLRSALDRLDRAVVGGEDLTEQMRGLRLPEYLP